MNISFAPLLLSLLLVTAAHATEAGTDSAKPSATEALQSLEAARAALASAVKTIEKDPPSTADLDAAHAAVERLDKAIQAAAVFQAQSLKSAKAVLGARRELRERGAYVQDRRAKIQLHELRRKIDAALAVMKARVSGLSAKEPSSSDFEEARAAIQAVKQLTDEARPLSSQDAKFASHLVSVDSTVAREQNAADDRWLQLSADKQRVTLGESLQQLGAAMKALGKTWSDSQFEVADGAAASLAKRIEEGAPLEAKDKAYRAEAQKARTELANARKRMAELVKEAGLARVKSEVEPANEELATAAKALKARRPSEDQLEHAKTAAIVVRKLMEKYEPQAKGSPELRQYLAGVKTTLEEVEVVLQVRAISGATAEAVQAIRRVEMRAPTDGHFEEAAGAVLVLEKTIGGVSLKNAEVRAHVGDARKFIRDGRATIAKRREQVELQRHRARLDEARRGATAAVAQLQKGTPSDAELAGAEEAVKQVGLVLAEGAAFVRKDRDYAGYAKDTTARIAELKDRIARRKIALAAVEGRNRLNERIALAEQKLDAASRPEATTVHVETATKAVEAISEALEAGAELESKDGGYASHAGRARNALGRLMETLVVATQARQLRKETAEALAAGISAFSAAGSQADMQKQKDGYGSAAAYFSSCVEEGARMVQETPSLASTVILLDGQPTSAKDVMAQCEARAEVTQKKVKEATGLLRIQEGPKKALEAARHHLGKAQKKEAMAQLGECIAEGRIVEHRWPELKGIKVSVAGGSLTVPEMIQQCVNERKAIEGQ